MKNTKLAHGRQPTRQKGIAKSIAALRESILNPTVTKPKAPRAPRKPKTHYGIIPPAEAGWECIGEGDAHDAHWAVYFIDNPYAAWKRVKVLATNGADNKANYATAYSPTERRLAGSGCFKKMIKNRPDLAELATYICQQKIP